jgi:hypothetical protein
MKRRDSNMDGRTDEGIKSVPIHSFWDEENKMWITPLNHSVEG